jgi:hypothetical protein
MYAIIDSRIELNIRFQIKQWFPNIGRLTTTLSLDNNSSAKISTAMI